MYKKNIVFAFCVLLIVILAGCASLKPVQNEIPLSKSDLTIQSTNPDDTKLVIFNNSNSFMFGIDGTGRINVMLNGRGLTQLNIGQYAQVIVPKGKYQVDLTHKDMVNFSSQHQVELVNPESYLEIYATPTSNEVKIVPALPQDFSKRFKPVN